MALRMQPLTVWLALTVLVAGCMAPPPDGPVDVRVGATPGGRGEAKRITIGLSLAPDTRPTAQGQANTIRSLLSAGLADADGRGVRHPKLAETVPSLENGLWKLFPDGRMETTWRIRDGARWHDGTPFTADDLLFSLQVGRERGMAAFSSPAYAAIEEATALDPRTLVVTWTQPYIEADALLSFPLTPLPGHLLASAYREDRTGLLDLPYWTQDYVGTGPYRVREWTPGVGVRLEANEAFVLGRPKIDEIEVKHLPDSDALLANLLAGTVDVGLVGLDRGLQLRERWREGTVAFNLGAAGRALYPQFIDPHPAIIADVRLRRALVHAIDRQEIVDTLIGGISPVAHSYLSPNDPSYREIEPTLTRYAYDPRRAAELLQELGYLKGADGTYGDAAGQRLEVEVRHGGGEKAAPAIVDYWQRAGVAASVADVPAQRRDDFAYVATFPGFWFSGQTGSLRMLHSSATPLPGNSFRVQGGGNQSRYVNPAFDDLLDTYFRTVPVPERTQVLGQIVRHIADEVTVIGLYYGVSPGATANRLLHVSSEWPGPLITWNAHEWDVRS